MHLVAEVFTFSFAYISLETPCCGLMDFHGLHVLDSCRRQMPADMKEFLDHACVVPPDLVR